ncbi:family 49 glycosyl hydrolase [Arthrobacter nitrophenolicus]|jgi:hypothetical protein|uniref:family 49 glycosyl hydrolase n=2 Tax=Arthrobacter TaxID=1663 RepID=UPI0038997FDB
MKHYLRLVAAAFALLLLLPAAGQEPAAATEQTGFTATGADLRTWWHSNDEYNTTSPTSNGAVRRSSSYEVQVATAAAPTTRYDSFTYMSIPRSGKGKINYTEPDGAEFSSSARLSMSWSSFEYATDVWVDVKLLTGQAITSTEQVTIRPSKYAFEKQLVDSSTVRVKVPYAASGYRFSVEFAPQNFTAYNDMSGTSGVLTEDPGGDNRAIHTEPRNSMMIFAEPVLTGAEAERVIPTAASGTVKYPEEGLVNNLEQVTEDIIYFRPGTYYMGSGYRAELPANVKWIYLAPGAYVKGAFYFGNSTQGVYKVTGRGVLSGEQYVYEADTANGFNHSSGVNCHNTCVKMLQFSSSSSMQQYLDVEGITISEPPYHSFVIYGPPNAYDMEMRVDNYKQVGSWYWQTDGLELYEGSRMNNTFFHANDDVLKLYHSNVTVDNTVIWKNENGPVIQWGWEPHTIENVVVTDTDVIHNRMYWKDAKYNTCIINSSSYWGNMGATNTADTAKTVKNFRLENINVEGTTNCAVRIYALANTENIHIKNLKIDGWNGLDYTSQASHLKRYSDTSSAKVALGNETVDSRGIKLENYSVGGTVIDKTTSNWSDTQPGRIAFDGENWDNWNAW